MNTDEGRYKIDTSYEEKLLSESPKWEAKPPKFTDGERDRFLKFIDEYKGMCAEDKQRICQDAIRITDAICRLSQSCGVSYYVAKDMVMEIMGILKKPQQTTAEQIIKDTIKKYIGGFYLDTDELLLALNKDLCERIKKAN